MKNMQLVLCFDEQNVSKKPFNQIRSLEAVGRLELAEHKLKFRSLWSFIKYNFQDLERFSETGMQAKDVGKVTDVQQRQMKIDI